jgi:hypothetical protein
MNRSTLNRSLLLLEIIEKEEGIDLKTLRRRNPETIGVLGIVFELSLVAMEEGYYFLTERKKTYSITLIN